MYDDVIEQYEILPHPRNPTIGRMTQAIAPQNGARIILRFKIRDQRGKIMIARCVLTSITNSVHANKNMRFVQGSIEGSERIKFWGYYAPSRTQGGGMMWIYSTPPSSSRGR